MTIITDTLHEDQCTLKITPRSFLFRMKNVSENKCRKNKNTHFYTTFFRKSCCLLDMQKNMFRAGQAKDYN